MIWIWKITMPVNCLELLLLQQPLRQLRLLHPPTAPLQPHRRNTTSTTVTTTDTTKSTTTRSSTQRTLTAPLPLNSHLHLLLYLQPMLRLLSLLVMTTAEIEVDRGTTAAATVKTAGAVKGAVKEVRGGGADVVDMLMARKAAMHLLPPLTQPQLHPLLTSLLVMNTTEMEVDRGATAAVTVKTAGAVRGVVKGEGADVDVDDMLMARKAAMYLLPPLTPPPPHPLLTSPLEASSVSCTRRRLLPSLQPGRPAPT
jgi:hypothetical protein